MLHPDLGQLTKAFTESQVAFFAVHNQLDRSTAALLVADRAGREAHAISAEHTQTFAEWIDALHAVERAAATLHDATIAAVRTSGWGPYDP